MNEYHPRKVLHVRRRGVIIVLSLLACWWICITCWVPYNALRSQELKVLPRYDALNEAVLAEMPPPDGAIETEHYTEGITTPRWVRAHGRTLYITYQRGDNNAEDVIEYYKQVMSSHGWSEPKILDNGTMFWYTRGTACVHIHVLWGSEYPIQPEYYDITIWHDYWRQSFSPHWPNMPRLKLGNYDVTLMEVYELGESYVMTCPIENN